MEDQTLVFLHWNPIMFSNIILNSGRFVTDLHLMNSVRIRNPPTTTPSQSRDTTPSQLPRCCPSPAHVPLPHTRASYMITFTMYWTYIIYCGLNMADIWQWKCDLWVYDRPHTGYSSLRWSFISPAVKKKNNDHNVEHGSGQRLTRIPWKQWGVR